MELLPTALGTRPRLAVEIKPEGVVAARAEDAQALVSAIAYSVLAQGTVTPQLKAGNFPGRAASVAAVRKALEAVALKERQTTLILPDASVRVLLLEFDALPAKALEALPIVRFRLKKLLPFDADDAVISYQIMSTQRGLIRVLAVAVSRDVLAEYEGVVREAGFEPGAVISSTLAACSGLAEDVSATLLVNAGETAVTTAIVQAGVLLLHRTVDLAAQGLHETAELAASSAAAVLTIPQELLALPLVDVESSAGEWAMQEPLTGYGVVDDDRISAQAAMQARQLADEIAAEASGEMEQELQREAMLPPVSSAVEIEAERLAAAAREVTQAVSVAAAYFEDTLEMAPGAVLTAGTLGAETLGHLLREAGFGQDEMRVVEMVDEAMLTGGASTARIPRGWMASVRGALRS